MAEMLTQTEEYLTVKEYLAGQTYRNIKEQIPGPTEDRKANMLKHLEEIKNSIWVVSREKQAEVIMAAEGRCLELNTPLREWTRYGENPPEQGARKFTWAVSMNEEDPKRPRTIFCDAETGRIGICWSDGWRITYEFPDNESYTLCIVENYLGEIFKPGCVVGKQKCLSLNRFNEVSVQETGLPQAA